MFVVGGGAEKEQGRVMEHLGKAIEMEAFFQETRSCVSAEDSSVGRMLWLATIGPHFHAIINLLKESARQHDQTNALDSRVNPRD